MKNKFLLSLCLVTPSIMAHGINYSCQNHVGFSVCVAGNEKTFVVRDRAEFENHRVELVKLGSDFCNDGYKARTLLANTNQTFNYECKSSNFSQAVEDNEFTDWCHTDGMDKTFFFALKNVCKKE